MTDPFPADPAFAGQLRELFRWRRDVRRFRPDPLPADMMDGLLRIAMLAPSVGNAQPWRFVRLRSAEWRDRMAAHVDAANAAAAALLPVHRRAAYRALKLHGIREAPELLAVFSDDAPDAGHGLGRATMPEMLRYSTVMAIHTLWLAARAHGIGVGWVSILDPVAVTAMLEVPSSWALVGLLCVGYPLEPATVPELERLGWQAREPLVNRLIER